MRMKTMVKQAKEKMVYFVDVNFNFDDNDLKEIKLAIDSFYNLKELEMIELEDYRELEKFADECINCILINYNDVQRGKEMEWLERNQESMIRQLKNKI